MKYLKRYNLFIESVKSDETPEIFKKVSNLIGSDIKDDIDGAIEKLDDYLEDNDDEIASKLYDDLFRVYLDIEASIIVEKIENIVNIELSNLEFDLLLDKIEDLLDNEFENNSELENFYDDLVEILEDLNEIEGKSEDEDLNESRKKKKRKKRRHNKKGSNRSKRRKKNTYNNVNYYGRPYYPFGYYNNYLGNYHTPSIYNNTTNNDYGNDVSIDTGGGSFTGDVSGGDMGGGE